MLNSLFSSVSSHYAPQASGNGVELDEAARWSEEKWRGNGANGPDCYQRLEFFIQVLRVLCPNLTDASHPPFTPHSVGSYLPHIPVGDA